MKLRGVTGLKYYTHAGAVLLCLLAYLLLSRSPPGMSRSRLGVDRALALSQRLFSLIQRYMMPDALYRVAGWIKHQPHDRPYTAEFGYYPTLDVAHRAAQAVARPGCIIHITLNGQTLATYRDGKLVCASEG